jgi:pyridoxamine 5'-phosphate oxidase
MVNGVVEKLTGAESDAYFAQRPRGSQLGAWASDQSQLIDGRPSLEARLVEVIERFEGADVPRPPHWGGYRLVPDEFDFWQGRENRMHDRLGYRRSADGGWRVERYMP